MNSKLAGEMQGKAESGERVRAGSRGSVLTSDVAVRQTV